MAKFNCLKKLWPFLIIILISGFIFSKNITKPFIGHHDWNGVFYSNIARNYLKLGLKATQLGQVTNSGTPSTDQLNFYTHYPPLMPLLLALDFKLLGITDLTARLFPIALTILSLLTIFRMTQKLKLHTLTGLSSILIVFTPMLRYFSQMPSQEALMIFLTIFSVNLYLSLLTNPKPKHKYELYFTAVLNGLSGWAGYFIYPLLLIHSWFFHKKTFPIILKTIKLLIIVFFLHLGHTYLLTGSIIGGGLIDALLLRLNLYPLLNRTPPELPGQFTWLSYFIKQVRWLTIYYTATLLITSFINLTIIIRQLIKRQKLNLLETTVLIFLAWGLTYPIIFSNVVFVHEYFNLFFWPFLAFSLINLITRLQQLQNFSFKIVVSLLFFLGFLIFTERSKFLKTLNQTQAFLPGYKLGLEINQKTPENQTAYIIASEEFIDVQEIFIKYYADRRVEYLTFKDQLPDKDKLPDSQFIFYPEKSDTIN